ncbi:MAG: SMC-Scp complex subunit ScpB [Planctomycetes bacterium]|nr:SMC-Scp complex subunit ScpB [Planctomycetota bacterium]
MESVVSEPSVPEASGAVPTVTEPVPEAAPEKARLGPGEAKNDEQLTRELAVLLFAASEPLSPARLVELLERPAPARVPAALERLGAQLEAAGLPVVLRKIAGAWRLLSDPEFSHVVGRLLAEPKPERISAAALETLAIIAYRQPVSKAEIEAIRGVQAGPVLRSLVDRGLVRISGRADLPGSPLLYATTQSFLERFGLAALKELPRDGELNED